MEEQLIQLRGVQEDQIDLAAVDQELTRIFPNRKIKRALFVIPPDADPSLFNYDTAKRGRYWNYPPYGVGAIASHLRNEGIEVNVINLNNEILKACAKTKTADEFNFDRVWQEALVAALVRYGPDLVGLSCMFSQTHNSTVNVLREIKRLYPSLPVAIGGVHITNCLISAKTTDSFMDDMRQVDFFFSYESELAIKTFVNVVNRKTSAAELLQVMFNSSSTKFSFLNKRATPDGKDLDIIPALDLMKLDEISNYGKIGSFYSLKPAGTRFATVLSNRGCRARCTFCSVRNFNGGGVRQRSVQSVIDELLILKNEYNIGHVMWLDDDFLKGEERAIELFNQMVKQNVGITWDCTNGVIAASCTDQLMAAAAASGCLGINIGMESGNREILKQIRKPGTVETFLEASQVLKKYPQINARVFLMIGFPNETYRQILDTINVALEMNLDWYNVTILQPLPNTPLFDSMVAQGLIKDVKFDEIRYNSGAYGKHRKMAYERNIDMLATDFKDAFTEENLDRVPARDELDDIWAYMNFHLNFRRLFREDRPVKLRQQIAYVQNITDLVAPENAFAMYFLGYLQHKLNGKIEIETIEKLDGHLTGSDYWQTRFADFKLGVDDLKTGRFPQ